MKVVKITTAAFLAGVTTLAVSLPASAQDDKAARKLLNPVPASYNMFADVETIFDDLKVK